MNDALPTPVPDNAYQARQWIKALLLQLAQQQQTMRDPPEEPDSCCGRGCDGCVWFGYFDAVGYWCEQARQALLKA
jgi:hypothetical protein